MADRQLAITIVVDNTQAKRDLADVDKAVQKVAASTDAASEAVSAYEQQVQSLTRSKQAASAAIDIFDKHTHDVTDTMNAAREATQLNSLEISNLFDWVNRGGQGWAGYTERVKDAWTALRNFPSEIRSTINGFADGLGLTVQNLGLFNAAALVAATAMASWKIGEKIGQWTGLHDAIARATAAALGWGDVTGEQAGAKADVLARASATAGRSITDLSEAMRINEAAFLANQHGAEDWNAALDRMKAPQQLANELANWHNEIQLLTQAGVLDHFKADVQSQAFSVADLADKYKISQGAVSLYRQELNAASEAAKKAAAEQAKAAKEAVRAYEEWSRALDQHYAVQEKDRIGAEKAVAQSLKGQNVLMDLSVQMGDVTMHGTQMAQQLGVVGDQSGYAARKMAELKENTSTLKTVFKDLFSGNFGDAFSNIFAGLKNSFNPANILNSMIGGGLSELVSTGVGLLGKGLSALFHIGGPSQQELQGRQSESQFEQSFGGFQQMLDAIGKAYVATGRSAQQAQSDVANLLAAEKNGQAATQQWIDTINQAFDEQKQDAADLTAAIDRYHFSIEELGPAMQKQNLDDQAKQILNDWRLLVDSGIQVSTVNTHMADTVNQYLQLARRTGQEVPTAMQPILQQMINQGLLTDEAGNKITDLASIGVSFAETMTQGFNKVVQKLDELLQKIGVALPQAIASVPTSFNVDVDLNARWNIPDMPRAETFHRGGVVMPFVARAHSGLAIDEVPIIAQRGEGILNRGAMKRIGGAQGLSRLNNGASGESPTVVQTTINVDGYIDSPKAQRNLARIVDQQLAKTLRLQLRVS